MQKSRFRAKQNNFTMVSNDIIFNNELSRDARILYVMIQAKITIPNYTLYKTTLIKLFGANEKTFDRYWKELKTKGYLIQYKLADEQNKFYYEYELLDEPNIELAEKVHAENNESKKDKEKEPKKVTKKTPKSPKTQGSSHTPLFEGVELSGGGKLGGYNNTDLINTDNNNTDNNTTTSKTKTKKDSNESVVVDTTNQILIESKTKLRLKPCDVVAVSEWDDIDKLNRAIEIFNELNGQKLALLFKIYNDGAKRSLSQNSTSAVSNKIANFNSLGENGREVNHDTVMQLDRLLQDYKLGYITKEEYENMRNVLMQQ